MLDASAAPVKQEGQRPEHQRQPQAGKPNPQELGQPVTFGGNAEFVAAKKVDLGREKGQGHDQ